MPSNKLQVVFRGIPTSSGVRELIVRKLDKLERQRGQILSCRVVIERPHLHQHKGQHVQVTVDLSIPNDELVVCKGERERGYRNVYAAVRDAFAALQSRLQRRLTRRRTHSRYLPSLTSSVAAV